MTQLFFNNFKQELDGAILVSDTVITLDDASALPASVAAGDFYLLTITDSSPVETQWEIVRVETGRSGNDVTVIRAQEGTTALAWGNASRVQTRVTAETLDSFATGGGGGGGSLDADAILTDGDSVLIGEGNVLTDGS